MEESPHTLQQMWQILGESQKPVMVIGSQAMLPGGNRAAEKLAKAVQDIGIPVFLGKCRDCNLTLHFGGGSRTTFFCVRSCNTY